MRQSDRGQISGAAGGDALHHHCRLFSHFWKVCVLRRPCWDFTSKRLEIGIFWIPSIPTCLHLTGRKIWTTPSAYLRWESARCRLWLCYVTHLCPAWVWQTLNLQVCLFQFHAEVYFDQEQQGYMLVDQGSQNGTVINGNRILQVSACSEFSN